METEKNKCWIFGDESGQIDRDRFFAIGILGTRNPKEVILKLKEIRKRTNFFGEVSYKSSDKRRALCAIRWTDWFFSGQQIMHYKILIKDKKNFNVEYFQENKYKTGAAPLAYVQSYKEVLGNFADYNEDTKVLFYSQIGLAKMQIEDYLDEKIKGLSRRNCFPRHCIEKKKDGNGYTGAAELLQFCDLLTGTTRGLCSSVHGEETTEDWVKNMLRKNIHYHMPSIKDSLSSGKNFYFPLFSPFEKQLFTVFRCIYETPKGL